MKIEEINESEDEQACSLCGKKKDSSSEIQFSITRPHLCVHCEKDTFGH